MDALSTQFFNQADPGPGNNRYIVGFAQECSTKPELEQQVAELQKLGANVIFKEDVTSPSQPRPVFEEAIRYVRAGDLFVAMSMLSLERSLPDLYSTVEKLTARGATVHFLQENTRFSQNEEEPLAKLSFELLGSIIAFKKSLKQEQQAFSAAKQKKSSADRGRPSKVSEDLISKAEKLDAAGVPKSQIAKKLGIARSTLYYHLNKTGEN